MLRRNYLTLTYITEEIFEDEEKHQQFLVYLNSATRNIPDCNYVFLTHNLSEKWEDQIHYADLGGIDVVRVDECEYIFRDRHLAYWKYLLDHGHKYKNVLISDCRDVFFQKNPFDWIEVWKSRFNNIKGDHSFLNNFAIVTSEGFKMSRSGFATVENFKFERNVPEKFRVDTEKQRVVNGGVSLGTSDALKNYHFLVWSLMVKTNHPCTDQAAINWAFRYLKDDETYSISYPQQDVLCLTGEGVKEGVVKGRAESGFYCNDSIGEPYYMIHQWDRIEDDSLRDILAQYR